MLEDSLSSPYFRLTKSIQVLEFIWFDFFDSGSCLFLLFKEFAKQAQVSTLVKIVNYLLSRQAAR